MLVTIHVLNKTLPFLYLATFLIYMYNFFKENRKIYNIKRVFLFLTLLVHVFYLIIRANEFNHPPIINKYEIFSVLAFTLSFAYFLLELLTDIRETGMFILIFSLFFQTLSSIFIIDNYEVDEILRSNLLGFHVISALLGYSGFTIAAVYGGLFFLLYKNIKSNKYGLVFNRLPSLEILEKLNFYSVVIGFILLTIGILIGFIWLPKAFPNITYTDPKLISSGIIWLVFGIGIIAKVVANLYGKKVIIFSLIGYALALGSLLIFNVLLKSFHSFY